jgi:protocatechuate 3,4-dioxygenase beta subunit
MMRSSLWLLSLLFWLSSACTMLIANPTPCRLTEGYSLGSEEIAQEVAPSILELASTDEPGDRLIVTGVVYAADCTTPLADAMIEAWQADAAGVYNNLAGTLRTDANGRYELLTIKPGYYAGETDPPPLHIHLRVDHPQARGIETELLFAGDPQLQPGNQLQATLVITPQQTTTASGPVLHAQFDLVLADQ